MATEPPRRRHGAQLEADLLAAAWDELVDTGYARMTMATVATRAHTSEPVLYRRWGNKDELVLAALQARRVAHPVTDTDTGALRTDLIDALTTVGRALAGFYAIAVAASLAGLLADTGLSPKQVRAKIMTAQGLPSTRPLYQRAHDRGELDLRRVPRAVLELPFDLVRHDLLLDLGAPPAKRVRSIVDELFLPLVQHHTTAG